MIARRRLLALPLAALVRADFAGRGWRTARARHAAALPFSGEPAHFRTVDPERGLEFPRDFGAHRGYRIEWWYLTGWLFDASKDNGVALGFQATFFRIGTRYPRGNPSRFAPTDLIAAHAALMNQALGHPLKAELLVNAGGAGVILDETDTHLRVGDWSLARSANDRYRTRLTTRDFSWDLALDSSHAPDVWQQGERGFSRKGPLPSQASHYYSRPQLRPAGQVTIDGRPREVTGIAWFDHEWSSTLLGDTAGGWDWAGLNLHDGRSIVWFVVRHEQSGEPLQTYAALRAQDGRTQRLSSSPPRVLQRWTSSVTGAAYPIGIAIDFAASGPAIASANEPWACRPPPSG